MSERQPAPPAAVNTVRLDAAAERADEALTEVAARLSFLASVTPLDRPGLWRSFDADGAMPALQYAPVEVDVDAELAELAALPVDDVADPDVRRLLDEKRAELELLLRMVRARGSSEFLPLSLQVSGPVRDDVVDLAEQILTEVPPEADEPPTVDATAFAAVAQRELDRYRASVPDLRSEVRIDEASSGLMVVDGSLLVAPSERVEVARIEALVAHEVGTHVVATVNGARQALGIMASGLAGYEPTQEGLAVLAEHLVGGLTAGRLRELAARVAAVATLLDGAAFAEAHASLVAKGVPRRTAFTVVLRVYRGGGLVKDAGYLQGLVDVVGYVRRGGDLDRLTVGQVPLSALTALARLGQRGVVTAPVLRPRHLGAPGARRRLEHVRRGAPIIELAAGSASS